MIRSILLLQVAQVLGRGAYVLFTLWYINRALGVEAKGTWAGLMALLGITASFSNLGFEVWLTREVAARRITRGNAHRFLFQAKTLPWLVCIAIGAYYASKEGYPLMVALPFAFALIFDGVGVAQQAVFEGNSQAKHIALMSFLKSGGFVILAVPVAFFLKPEHLTPFAWLFAATLLLRNFYGHRAWKLMPEHISNAGSLAPDAWKAFVVMGSYIFVTKVYFSIDVLMITSILDKGWAGMYDNAYNFVEGALFLSAAAGTMLYPRLIQSEGDARGRIFDAMYLVVLVMGICGALGLWWLGPTVGDLLVGANTFSMSHQALFILACSLPIMFTNGLLNRWLFAQHRERFALLTAVIAALVNLIGNAVLIPIAGIEGAALMTVVTEGALMIIWLLWGRRSWSLVMAVLLGGGSIVLLGFLHHLEVVGPWAAVGGLLVGTTIFFYRLRRFHQVERGTRPSAPAAD